MSAKEQDTKPEKDWFEEETEPVEIEEQKPINIIEVRKKVTQLDGYIKRVRGRIKRYQEDLSHLRALSTEEMKLLKKGKDMYHIEDNMGYHV